MDVQGFSRIFIDFLYIFKAIQRISTLSRTLGWAFGVRELKTGSPRRGRVVKAVPSEAEVAPHAEQAAGKDKTANVAPRRPLVGSHCVRGAYLQNLNFYEIT